MAITNSRMSETPMRWEDYMQVISQNVVKGDDRIIVA
jgi:hypothetical protein